MKAMKIITSCPACGMLQPPVVFPAKTMIMLSATLEIHQLTCACGFVGTPLVEEITGVELIEEKITSKKGGK